MSVPIRVNDDLAREAEIEGDLMHRSMPKQVEYWAELGKRLSNSLRPKDLLALMQGIAEIRVEIPPPPTVEAEEVFEAVEMASASGRLGPQLTQGYMYYEASTNRPGYLEQEMPDGTRRIGQFKDGEFIAE